MREIFKKPTFAGPVELPEDPYKSAELEFVNRFGSRVKQAANWRIAALSSLLGNIIILALLSYLVLSKETKIVAVKVSELSGDYEYLGQISKKDYSPSEKQRKEFIREFVVGVRGVSLDPVVIRANLIMSFGRVLGGAKTKLSEYINKHNDSPKKVYGNGTVTVQNVRMLKINNSSSYQVRWEEKRYDKRGSRRKKQNMSAILTIEQKEPSTDENLLKVNPFGLYIVDFSWDVEPNIKN